PEADLDGDRAADEFPGPHACGDAASVIDDDRAGLSAVGDVLAEGAFVADAFDRLARVHIALVDALGEFPHAPAPGSEGAFEGFGRCAPGIAEGADAEAVQPLLCRGAHAPHAADGERIEHALDVAG